MRESELLNQILTDFCQQKTPAPERRHELQAFCQYAAEWLHENSCVGVGPAASGLLLRFADGRQLALFSDSGSAGSSDTPAVAISMTKDKSPRTVMADTTPSVSITGRNN